MYGGSTPETMVAQCLPPPLSTFIDDNIARKREKKREKVSLLCPETRSLRRKLVLLLLNKLWSAVVSGQQRQHMMYNLFFVDNIIALPIGKKERAGVCSVIIIWRDWRKLAAVEKVVVVVVLATREDTIAAAAAVQWLLLHLFLFSPTTF